ncbi:unnamed protein product [Microthlaspi erraticum]|uniref:Uncharacterized protein n=1 Tax=Microthlaspi erraticum TaxID=1685480 RepID=A0A6D2KG20_9BRAS|nr:unnamed protein product [Microthlaspi erraticum]
MMTYRSDGLTPQTCYVTSATLGFGDLDLQIKTITYGFKRTTIDGGINITESTALPGTYSRENSKENESEYYHIRYIHACEASWRLFNHLSQANIRTVQRLPPHPYNVGSVGVQTTRFTRWIAANMTEPHRLRNATARMFFRWDPALREWTDMWREYPLLSCWYLRHRSTRGSSASVDHLYFV